MNYDVILFAAQSDVDESHRAWMAKNGVLYIADLDLGQLDRFSISNPRLSPAALYRLLAPDYLAGRYDRLLYLDVDVGIYGALAPLLSLDLAPFGIAASPSGDIPALMTGKEEQAKADDSFRKLGMSKPFRFFNSGVMLIDVDWWNRNEVGLRALEFLFHNFEICPFLDENALNAILDGGFARLSPVWNFRSWTFRVPGVRKFIDPVVVHFDGPVKPWKRFGGLRPMFHYQREYQEYRAFLEGTPWQGWLQEQWKFGDLRLNIRFAIGTWLARKRGGMSWLAYSSSEQRTIEQAFEEYCQFKPFADVEQGLVIHDRGVLRLAS